MTLSEAPQSSWGIRGITVVSDKVFVTKAFLPPIDEYQQYLDRIWQSGHLTNQGPLLHELQTEIVSYLGLRADFHFVTNGTLALQVALRALDFTEGEIITTPFSYVATTSSILWERCQPVYVDIEPDTLCMDPDKIEAAITGRTKAIMPVHVFGNPCDVERIEAIAKKHDLKVIYDAAHAFGVKYKGRTLLSYGDVATCSFHATKPFHTIEGGAIITHDKALSDKAELIKRFGHEGDVHHMLGTNAKVSEFNAAMGLCNLKHIDDIIEKRRQVSAKYDGLLNGKFQKLVLREGTEHNYAYYPVILADERELIRYKDALEKQNVFPRRYFYPALHKLEYVPSNEEFPVAEDIASRILCLPLYPDLEEETINKICEVLTS